MTAAERLAALREKKKQFALATSPTGRLDGSTRTGEENRNRKEKEVDENPSDQSDDEGVSSEESDIDEDGNIIFDDASKIKPNDFVFDQRGIVFRKVQTPHQQLGSIAPPAASIVRSVEPHIVQPSALHSLYENTKRRQQALQNQLVLRGTLPLAAKEYNPEEAYRLHQLSLGAENKEDNDQDESANLLAKSDRDGQALLQDEGFFMPEVPNGVPRQNIARLEDRLLREMETEVIRIRGVKPNQQNEPNQSTADSWFTQGGSLNVEEDPSNANITQPVDADPILADKFSLDWCATHLVPPSENACTSANANGVASAGLDISIHAIAFDDHPLFIEEDVAATKLRGLFRKYQTKVQDNLLDYLTSHLGALLEYESQLSHNKSNSDALFDVRRQILDMFSRRLSEELELRELTRETYEQWLDLKNTRTRQGFCSTNLKLVAMHQEPSHSSRQVDLQFKQVSELVKHCLDGRLEGNALQKAEDLMNRYKLSRPTKGLKKSGKQKRKSSRHSSIDKSDDNLDEDGLIDSGHIVLRLTTDGPYDKDEEVEAKELKRRRSIRNEKIRIITYVNGHSVAQTAEASLNFPTFTATWNRVFCLKLQQRPSGLRFEVCSTGGIFHYKKTLAHVHVPVPASEFSANVLAHGVGTEDQWHQFSARKPIRHWMWDRSHPKSKKTLRELYSEQLRNDEHLMTSPAPEDRFTSGQLRVAVAWNTRDAEELSSGQNYAEIENNGSSSGTLVGLPEWAQSREEKNERFLGDHAADLAGGDMAGGGGGVSGDAVEFDDAIPDFANEVDFQKLIQELKGLDPNDPRNASVLRLFDIIRWSSKRGVLFRSEAVLRDALFSTANADKFVETRRVALMRIRREKPHLFHHPIPVSEEEIKEEEALQMLLLPAEAQMELDQDGDYAASGHSSSEVLRIQRLQKARINDFLQRIRSLQSSNVNVQRRRDIPLGSVVKEGPLPQFSVNMDMFRALFEPRRRLRPAPKVRKPASLSVEKAAIFVQVVRAQNVPVRRQGSQNVYPLSPGRSPMQGTGAKRLSPRRSPRGRSATQDASEDREDDDLDGPSSGSERVMSFVQVRFQGVSRRSSAQEGPSPTWNESIFLPFIPPRKDFSPANLQSIGDQVHFNLFDEVIVETQGEDYRNEDAMFQRRERRYLGSFSIPFSTIYRNGRIEGMFRVETPDVNLGYLQRMRGVSGTESGVLKSPDDLENMRADMNNISEIAEQAKDEAADATYVYLMATLDPVLATAKEEKGTLPGSGEDPKVVRYAKQWVEQVKRKATRKAKVNTQVFGVGIDGDAIFAPRFIAPQIPPGGQDGTELQNVAALVRFVSLVPFLDDWQAFVEGGDDVWSTSQQFLDIAAGDWEEHAILLCNYLSWLFRDRPSVEPYIIMGDGIPEGATVYVLLVDHSSTSRLLFNASTGRTYNINDSNCPLREVSLVMNDRNIWANIQENGAPWKVRWNFENTKDWTPFWTSRIPRIELSSVQTEVLNYDRFHRRFVSYLEGEISDQIQKSMRRWRAKRGTTRFNKIVGRKLRSLLESLEEQRLMGFPGGVGAVIHSHLEALRETMANNDVFGFPLNMTFTEMDAILRTVKNTDIHNTTLDNTTFALGVLVVPYTSKIFSVWIYLATVVSTRF